MYAWLKRECDDQSVAELSIWYTITFVGSFVIVFLLWGTLSGALLDRESHDLNELQKVSLLVTLSLWLITLIWMWGSLVRIIWKSGSERLGTHIFKYLQRGFFVTTLIVMLPGILAGEEIKILMMMLLGFDFAIAVIIVNFLTLAWMARCRIPLAAYWDIGTIVAMIVLQVWMFT